jgi:hypothetical protein
VAKVKRRKWSEKELAFIQRWHRTRTTQWIADRIEAVDSQPRTLKAVEYKMQKMAMSDFVPDGYVRPHWLRDAPNRGKLYQTVIREARRAGVLQRQTHSAKRPHIVPAAWLDKFLEDREKGAYGYTQEEIREQWYTTAQIAAICKRRPDNFAGMLTTATTKLRYIFDAVPVRRWHDPMAHGKKLYWHPDDVREALRQWFAYKATKAHANPKMNLLHNHAGSTVND